MIEPPVGAVVQDVDGVVWQRNLDFWRDHTQQRLLRWHQLDHPTLLIPTQPLLDLLADIPETEACDSSEFGRGVTHAIRLIREHIITSA
jgi:hypothetical protein